MYHIVIQQAGAHARLAMSKSHRSAGASMNTRPGHLSGGDALIGKQPRRVSPPQRRKKVRSFSPATCAAEKIPLGLQTCAPSAAGGQRVRCSQAAALCPKVILLGRETGSAARSLSDCTTVFTCGSTKCPCSRGRSGSTPCSRPACGTLPQTAGTRARRARAPATWPRRCRNP